MDNSGQIEFWNGVGGEKWARAEDRLERGIAGFGAAVLAAAAARPGEVVLDIGCGTGPTTLALARVVTPGGSVTGVDVSVPLLEIARRRAREAALGNVSFVEADAAVHGFPPAAADLLFSRFGVMFFADPARAFANLAAALRPGGRVAFACWRPFKENGWAFLPFMTAVPHLPPIERPAPDAPGPFAFGDPDRVRSVLQAAGFAGIALEKYDLPFPLATAGLAAGGLEEALRQVTEFGPLAQPLAQAPEDRREAAIAALRRTLPSHFTEDGLTLPGAVWIVTAHRP